MTEAEFLEQLAARGYGDAQLKVYPPHSDAPQHTHEFAVMLLVLEGEFTLAEPDRSTTYLPGEVLELAADCPHVERTGDQGARVLLAKR